ncbi:MAG: phosphatase [Campylobacterota bacterium]
MIAIDLGSNTIRFVEYDGCEWGRSFEKIVRTAEGLNESGLIGENAQRRIIEAIAQARERMEWKNQSVVAYTTAAMRRARNASEVLERIERECGLRFEIIGPMKEASLTLLAVQYRLKKLGIGAEAFVLADIGGGSTELIRVEGGESRAVSIEKGIVTLSESVSRPERLGEKIAEFAACVRDALPAGSGSLVLTAGTPTTIAAYVNGMDYETYDPGRINGYVLSLRECYRAYDELLAMDEARRTRYVGVGRENLIVAGILMVTALYEALGHEQAIVVDDGLREGIALDYFHRMSDTSAL